MLAPGKFNIEVGRALEQLKEALDFASRHSNASLVLFQLPSCIHNCVRRTLSMDRF